MVFGRKKYKFYKAVFFFTILFSFVFSTYVGAASPTGADWFQLTVNPSTGNDNTGDGGTGNYDDLNYFYVGQQFTTDIQVNSGGTNAANIWIDYNSATTTASNLMAGGYYNVWSNQQIYPNHRGAGLGRILSTGSNIPLAYSSGLGSFGEIDWIMVRPSATNYGTSTPELLDINEGVIGLTTESNISLVGVDILDDVEDFRYHIWADTKKPYAENPGPISGSIGVPIDQNFTFDLRDSKNGEGDNSGVGTGVNIATPPGSITFDNGSGAVDYSPFDNYVCSGIWGTNLCNTTINPPSPLAIVGDQRNWEYNTNYTVILSGYEDLASSLQNQLGDTNGPNIMNAKIWTFRTEADTVAPIVVAESPARNSASNSVSTNVSVDIVDKKTHPGTISGVGLDASTCKINISSPSFVSTTYSQSHPAVSLTSIPYGSRFTVNPSFDFGEYETVTVTVYDCEDLEGNKMTTDIFIFSTADSQAPYVDQIIPADKTPISADTTFGFHVKDDTGGVNLNDVVVYVNGVYFTNTGGAVNVATGGTQITATSSLNFNGGNYAGDTSTVTGTANDYSFTIDPENNFVSGETVPVIIYVRDQSGNLMEREVFALSVSGSSVCIGEACCNADVTWDGSLCLGTGGGGGTAPCPPCETCETCESCETCPTCPTCRDQCACEDCAECETCESCTECDECETCEDCAECETCEACAECEVCEDCPVGETCPTCPDCSNEIIYTGCEDELTCPGPPVCEECVECEPCPSCNGGKTSLLHFINAKNKFSPKVALEMSVADAASPIGNDWFELAANYWTGGDNTGDGDGVLNYYYVGQQITTDISINSGGTTAANIWVDYNSLISTAANLTTGNYYNVWSNQTISPNYRGANLGRLFSTGSNIPLVQSSGNGYFGSVDWTFNRPSQVAYGTSSAEVFDINIGNIGSTTESNISLSGADILDDAEDFQFYVWADTVRPFATNANPANGTGSVSVDANYNFELRDTLNGEGDNSGVGTGVIATSGIVMVDDGSGAVNYTSYVSDSCSGIWGTDLCDMIVNPPSPISLGADQRNWDYSTTYTVSINGYRDRASNNQNQLGDANGPNTMNAKSWNFTTEADTIAPQVIQVSPARSSSGNSVATNIEVHVVDKKAHPGNVSGTGVNATSCRIDVASASSTVTYSSVSAGVTVNAVDYGYQFIIDPASDFNQNEVISVKVYNCEDLTIPIANLMSDDTYTFQISDSSDPYVDARVPDNDSQMAGSDPITFHLKDDGAGISLANTVVYIDGVYYTNTGGAVNVAAGGTKISSASSLNFNGGNYAGDTTGVSGSPQDYLFNIKPSADFSLGEPIVVIIYSEDLDGNLMERDAYGVYVGTGSLCLGQNCCGANSAWTGSMCSNSGGGGMLPCTRTCPACDTCDACDTCENCQTCDCDSYCNDCAVCDTCDTCEECSTCETCETCEDCVDEECGDCPTCETCSTCAIDGECEECRACESVISDGCPLGSSCPEYMPCQICDTCECAPCYEDEDGDEEDALLPTVKAFIARIQDRTFFSNILDAFRDSPAVKTASNVVAVAYFALAIAQLASIIDSFTQLPQVLFNLFNMLVYKRERELKKGIVYDAATSMPISLAKVEIFDDQGALKETKVTDKYGSYFFLVPEGKYTIQVSKKGYLIMNGEEAKKISTVYKPLYTDKQLLSYEKEDMITVGIPMKLAEQKPARKFLSKSTMYFIMDVLFWAGLAFSVIIAILSPSVYNYVVCVLYMFFWLLRVANVAKPKWGVVKAFDGTLQVFSMVQIMDNKDKLLSRAVTDQKGRYAFVLDKGDYKVDARSSDGRSGKEEVVAKRRGIIAKNITVK